MECHAADKKNEAILQGLRVKDLQNILSEKKQTMKQWITCYYLGGRCRIFINGYKICVGEQVARGTYVEKRFGDRTLKGYSFGLSNYFIMNINSILNKENKQS